MECRVSAFSRVGGREHNEDACGYVEKDGIVCCVLADGAGGHQGGEVASRVAVQSVLDDFLTGPEVSAAALSRIMDNANRAVLRRQEDLPELADMRSTLVVLLFDPARSSAVWGHVGDSRLYLFRGGAFHLRTRDHSLVQSMVDSGMLSQSEAARHPDANVLFASIGLQDAFMPTVLDAPYALCVGDAFLLCSDGVWSAVAEDGFQQCLHSASDSDAWLRCIEQKVSAGVAAGSDNYSAVGIWYGDAGDFMHTIPLAGKA
ncbi:PP2C family protein-serine/threonine phosphatase [Noviherbaspirillum sp.]|uniref:PP2C family protein-serine/threonine phosphatase n=1 Tax=Noviherbaspirillum sp. TaxID=1926288 RepID=UPI002D5BD6D0|nr:protein phosphatase 2C domain-containing protein [Noviherbaspirillum sp.]HZW19958.1 protein phosphatase 2C domain-containing protein [Noviherbaspirillum sp.]